MPNTCHECKYSKCYFYGKAWQTIDGTKDYRSDRDKTCPLKSIDELIEYVTNHVYHGGKVREDIADAYYIGANDAIKAIEIFCGIK